jgi:predicted enzyme related to lactoylglutathione lyase
MPKVVHFEWATPDPAREIEFLESVLGWKIASWGEEQYWLVDTGDEDRGINGALMPLSAPEQPRVVNTVEVVDLDSSLDRAIASGATLAMGRQEIPNIGWIAYVISPTGIMFGMLEPMPGGGGM